MTEDEAITAFIAASKLTRLYHSYRAMYRGNGMMIHKLQGQVAVDEDLSEHAKIYAGQEFVQRKSYAQQMDQSMRLRIVQLSDRLDELKVWQP